MSHFLVDLLEAAWSLAVWRIIVSFAWVYRDNIWAMFDRSALLLAFVFCLVERCFGSRGLKKKPDRTLRQTQAAIGHSTPAHRG